MDDKLDKLYGIPAIIGMDEDFPLTSRVGNYLGISREKEMTQKPEVIKSWIEHVNNEGRNLTKWELDFMESITEQFEQRRFLSDKQEEILERIYSEKTPT